MNLQKFSFNVLKSLQESPVRYRNWGVYWYLVKFVLKRYYSKDNLFLLGDYIDNTVNQRIPKHSGIHDALEAAIQTYNLNAKFNMLSNKITDPNGESFILKDEDGDGI